MVNNAYMDAPKGADTAMLFVLLFGGRSIFSECSLNVGIILAINYGGIPPFLPL